MKKIFAFVAFMILMAGVASAQTQNAAANTNTEKKEQVIKEKSSCGKAENGKACCSKDKGVTGSTEKASCSGEKKEGAACCSKGEKKEGAACCSKDQKKEGGKCSGDGHKEGTPKP
jgi:hypothetical protein